MRTSQAMLFALTALLAPSAWAQTGNPYEGMAYRPPTAMSAWGQSPALRGQPTTRPAARHGLANPSVAGPVVRPFSGVTNRPAVSPYMHLFRDESEQAAPNYYTFVRPQLESQEIAAQQQQQLRQLQQRVRQASYNGAMVPTSGGAARYGDTGRYYSGWRR